MSRTSTSRFSVGSRRQLATFVSKIVMFWPRAMSLRILTTRIDELERQIDTREQVGTYDPGAYGSWSNV